MEWFTNASSEQLVFLVIAMIALVVSGLGIIYMLSVHRRNMLGLELEREEVREQLFTQLMISKTKRSIKQLDER
ncbi:MULTISPECIES: hypothetical protein [Vibrio]|uniref:hypothetical protein n=1 Tax=Vibrio TaxID=662 RepID=UPI00078D2213|nr:MULTISPECIES: hypothetical protein [Vibrio]BAU70895.1 hypothetical protein [Vibrio sp. 04Ya108]BBM67848.1 hypothetical protein VA249_44940 [Vibrio alfacsensis]BCN27018.1 hypothetical protein VYA_42100 [Vibrio alfacsensis]